VELFDQAEKDRKIAQLQHAIAWLAVDDKAQENEFERISRRRHDETCEWVIQEPSMKSWMKADIRHQILWLSGKPGAGM
jgi:hypothetical protein